MKTTLEYSLKYARRGMEAIKFMLPQSEIEPFRRFCAKIQKNVPEFKYSIGSAYDKVFKHSVRNIGSGYNFDRQWHRVCDVTGGDSGRQRMAIACNL